MRIILFSYMVVAKGKVCLCSQLIMIQIPVLQWWAAYRIKKLRLYLIIVFIPYSIANVIVELIDPNFSTWVVIMKFLEEGVIAMINFYPLWFLLTDIFFVGLGFLLMYIWSRAWNKQF